MSLCERASPIPALAGCLLVCGAVVDQNTRRAYNGNSAHWRLATESDNSATAWHAIFISGAVRGSAR